MRRAIAFASILPLISCSHARAPNADDGRTDASATNGSQGATDLDAATQTIAQGSSATDAGATLAMNDAGQTATAPELPLHTSLAVVGSVLFADASDPSAAWSASCPASLPEDARVRCLFDTRYRGDAQAASLAYALYEKHGVICGVEPAQHLDGGYRGSNISIVPAVPTGASRVHLEWVTIAFDDYSRLFDAITQSGAHAAYRMQPIEMHFMRTERVHTPNAYAHDWRVAYNLTGSILNNLTETRETLFHEIFHLNDQAHHDWSYSALAPEYDAIVKKCGARTPCLTPYSPGTTMVRNGTYYPFQPGNDVHEYAAELALRYYREERAAISGEKVPKPFKCGPPENRAAWDKIVREFFGGFDRVPACS